MASFEDFNPHAGLPEAAGDYTSEQSDEQRILDAVAIALDLGPTDGAHHKQWVLDQMVRILTGPNYETIISDYEGKDDPSDELGREWDEGIAP